MKEITLGVVEKHFAELVWKYEPLSSGELVKICNKELNWKKSTTYTVLRKLCEKGLFQNQNGIVTSRVSRQAFYSAKSEQFVEETFAGSLPAFIAAFAAGRVLSEEVVEEIQQLIDTFKGGE